MSQANSLTDETYSKGVLQMNRATMRVAIDEVFKANFSLFDSYDDIVKKEQIKKLSYIETIANQLEINIHGVNLMDILKNNNNIILATEAEINNSLLEFNREAYFNKIEEEREIVLLTDEQKETISESLNSTHKNKIRSLENDADYSMRKAETSMTDHNNYMCSVRNFRQQIKALEVVDPKSTIELINEAMKNPKFEFIGFSNYSSANDTLMFKTLNDCIITYKNERAGLDFRVNLGTFTFRFTLGGGLSFRIDRCENNIETNTHIHPHIGSSGDLCTGNMKEMFDESMEKCDINGVFNVALQVLENYNDSDPYINISHFAAMSDQIQPNGDKAEEVVLKSEYECYKCGYVFEFTHTFSDDSHIYEECPDCGHENEIYLPDYR